MKKMKSRIVSGAAAWLASCSLVTSALAHLWRYPAAFGGVPVGRYRVFLPGQFLSWYPVVHPGDRWALHAAGLVCLAVGAAMAYGARSAGTRDAGTGAGGAGRFQDEGDLRKTGLL